MGPTQKLQNQCITGFTGSYHLRCFFILDLLTITQHTQRIIDKKTEMVVPFFIFFIHYLKSFSIVLTNNVIMNLFHLVSLFVSPFICFSLLKSLIFSGDLYVCTLVVDVFLKFENLLHLKVEYNVLSTLLFSRIEFRI